MKSKYQKLLGIFLIVGGVMLFYNFFDIMIILLSNVDQTFINFLKSMILHVLPEMWHFHIPGFVLIISGIYCLFKAKRLKLKEA